MPFQLLPNPDRRPNRRDVLKGMAPGGASLALGRTALVATAEKDDSPWYALVSDIHIAADPSTKTRGECMTDNLRAVVADILASETPPLGVLIDGDLAYNHGESGDYKQDLSLLEPLRKAKLPITLAMGDHDQRPRFRAALNVDPPKDAEVVDRVVGTVSLPGLRSVVLDSLDKTNKTPDVFVDRQLEWLAKELDADAKTATLVFLQHNLADRPGALIDAKALRGPETRDPGQGHGLRSYPLLGPPGGRRPASCRPAGGRLSVRGGSTLGMVPASPGQERRR